MTWAWGPFLSLDLETTGIDPETARMVQVGLCEVGKVEPGKSGRVTATEYVNPGIPIPAEATEVHGITDHIVEQYGMGEVEALVSVRDGIREAQEAGTTLVVFNAPYDLTVIDRGLQRHGLGGLADDDLPMVVDPLVLVNRMAWKRPHNLEHACEIWKVPAGGHDAGQDALASARLLWRLAQEMRVQIKPEDAWLDHGVPAKGVLSLSDVPLDVLQRAQARWYRESAEGFITNQRDKGRDPGPVNTQWPIIRKAEV